MFHGKVTIHPLVEIVVRELSFSFLYVKVAIPNYNSFSLIVSTFDYYARSFVTMYPFGPQPREDLLH